MPDILEEDILDGEVPLGDLPQTGAVWHSGSTAAVLILVLSAGLTAAGFSLLLRRKED